MDEDDIFLIEDEEDNEDAIITFLNILTEVDLDLDDLGLDIDDLEDLDEDDFNNILSQIDLDDFILNDEED